MLNKKMALAVCATTIGVAITSTASFANDNQGQVTASALNIRSGPSTSYGVVTKAYKGDIVEILESSNGWHKVKLSNGTIGWGSSDYISTSPNSSEGSSDNNTSTGTKATVTASALNIRSGASTSYGIVTKAYKGDIVEILESSNGWYKVKLSDGKIGWASASYISTSSNSGGGSSDNSTSTPSTPSTGTKATVTASSLNIRSGASTSYSIVTKAYKGESVEILESSNGWHKVKLSDGKIGWASASYISTSSNSGGGSSDNSTSTPSTGTKATVTTSSLNIRSGASTSYSIVTTAYKGEIVEILESSNGWHKVKLSNGKIGWASASYISTSTNSGGESSNNTQDKAQAIVNLAKAQIGKPYVWGAEGPGSFDCSGLTYYVYGQNGVKLPRVSRDQYSAGTSVSLSNLQPGDLMFSSTDGSGNITHVSIYVGNGEMVHAPKPGDVVKTSSINTSYWQNAYVGAKRVL